MRTTILFLLFVAGAVAILTIEAARIRQLNADSSEAQRVFAKDQQVLLHSLAKATDRLQTLERSTPQPNRLVPAPNLLNGSWFEFSIPRLISRRRGIGDRMPGQFIVIDCTIRMSKADSMAMILPEKGDHTAHLLQESLEERLRNYYWEDLAAPGIYRVLRKDFDKVIETDLHDAYPSIPGSHHIIDELILTNLAVQ